MNSGMCLRENSSPKRLHRSRQAPEGPGRVALGQFGISADAVCMPATSSSGTPYKMQRGQGIAGFDLRTHQESRAGRSW